MADHLNNKPFGAWIAIDIAKVRIPRQREHPFHDRERSFQIDRERLFQG
jgi:hypothetical protein